MSPFKKRSLFIGPFDPLPGPLNGSIGVGLSSESGVTEAIE
jgi:hypothetical protein